MVGLTLLLSLAMGGAAGNPIVAGNDVISLPIPTPQQLAWQQNEIMVRATLAVQSTSSPVDL